MIVRGDPSPSVQLFKDGGFSEVDVGLILEGYERVLSTRKKPSLPQYSAAKEFQDKSQQSRQHEVQAQLDSGDPVAELQGLGIDVYEAKDAAGKKYMTWDDLAGYSEVKKYINETILMPLQHPEVYDDVVKFTRQHVERNRPRAVLLEGPPGTVMAIVLVQVTVIVCHLYFAGEDLDREDYCQRERQGDGALACGEHCVQVLRRIGEKVISGLPTPCLISALERVMNTQLSLLMM